MRGLEGVERITILGCPGAGKSTLARTLAVRLDLPLVHLDQVHWSAGWVERSAEETQARLDAALAPGRWVSDGNYGSYSAARYADTQRFIWLDYPRRICLRRAFRRIWSSWGVVRPDMAPGCPEQLDPGFIRWIWNWHRDKRPGVLVRFADVPQLALDAATSSPAPDETRLLWFRHPTQTAAWLASSPRLPRRNP